MAIRYVKDFEFPAAAGYTKSATPVKGQMLAKGGPAKAPKGIMVVIGVGKPSKGPMHRAKGGDVSDSDRMSQMAGDANALTDAEKVMANRSMAKSTPTKRVPARNESPYIPGTNLKTSDVYSPEDQTRLERGYKKGGKFEGSAKDEAQDRVLAKKHGLSKSDWEKTSLDTKHDKQESMKGLKRGGSAQNVQMAKTNAISASLAGQKKTPYAKGGKMCKADGGAIAAPMAGQAGPLGAMANRVQPQMQSSSAVAGTTNPLNRPGFGGKGFGGMDNDADDRMGGAHPAFNPNYTGVRHWGQHDGPAAGGSLAGTGGSAMGIEGPGRIGVALGRPDASTVGLKKGGKVHKALGGMMPMQAAPLSRMAARGVPVAPTAPMIAPPTSGKRIGVNAKRPGGPNVGAIRAAMAKAASASNPDSSPSMMKKGGKAKC